LFLANSFRIGILDIIAADYKTARGCCRNRVTLARVEIAAADNYAEIECSMK